MSHLDPFLLEVTRNALSNIVREMNVVMQRTAYSSIFSEALDFSCAVFDRHANMVAQAEAAPIHLAAMGFSVQACLDRFGTSDLEPGDVLMHNDPFNGGSHLNDVTVMMPVFMGEELVFIVANRAHHLDLGGMAPAGFVPQAREIFQEGLCIPPIKIFSNGIQQDGVWDLITANSRLPHLLRGDIMAQVSASRRGESRLRGMLERYGREVMEMMVDAIIENTESRIRSEIEMIPDGVYTFEDYMDNDGINSEPLKLHVTVTVQGSDITVDFTGSSPQGEGAFNAVFPVTCGATYVEVISLTDRTIPINSGSYRPVRVNAPKGTFLNAEWPCATMFGNTEVSQRVAEVVRGALAPVLPEKVAAAHVGTTRQCIAWGPSGTDSDSYIWYQFPGGGMGGYEGGDGSSAMMAEMSNCRNTPIEVFESQYPWRVLRMELRQDSGGPGKFRGGLGLIKEYMLLEEKAEISTVMDRVNHPPFGLFEGQPGKSGQYSYIRDGVETRLPPKVAGVALKKGDILILQSPGGGGYGPVSQRDPERVKLDVLRGYISAHAAEKVYGVEVSASGNPKVEERLV